MASASATAFCAFSASVVPSPLPETGDASSRFTTSILYSATMPPVCSTARSTARFMAVPSGIIAPCIGHLVYSLMRPLGCSPATIGAMPRARKQITTHRLYCEILHPFILGLLSPHSSLGATHRSRLDAARDQLSTDHCALTVYQRLGRCQCRSGPGLRGFGRRR